MVALTCIFGTLNINKDHVKKKSKKLEIKKGSTVKYLQRRFRTTIIMKTGPEVFKSALSWNITGRLKEKSINYN